MFYPRSTRIDRALLVFALAATSLYGDPQNDPRMVDLNVVVVDNRGQAVVDLTRDDFRVTDSGKPQTIAFFRHRDSSFAHAPSLEPGESSNRTAANVPRATVILFDMLNQKFGTRGATANRLVEDLRSLESADYVYLYLITVNGRLYPVHGLPGAEGETGPSDGTPWTRHAKPLLDQAFRAVLQVRPVGTLEDVQYRALMTFDALDAMARQLAIVPGRKSIVWLTDGVPIELGPHRSETGDFVDFTPQLRAMSEAFDRSGVSIYPVRTIMMGSPDNVNGAGHDGLGSIATVDTFADLTGGRLNSGKDIGAALRQAISDMRTSYQIGYYPAGTSWDNKFHKLRITCTRKGVRVQAKSGYYAWQEPPGTQSNQAMLAALSTRFDAAEIGLRASLSRDPRGGRGVRLVAHIDAHDVVLAQQGDRYEGQLRIAIAGLVAGGRPQVSGIIPFDLHFTSDERDRALDQGIGFAQEINVSDETASIRLIVYDRGSHAVGSATIPVPPPARSKP